MGTKARVSASVDPLPGFADFEITGTAAGGSVTAGIDGVSATVATTLGESDVDIMNALIAAFATNDNQTEDVVDIATPPTMNLRN